MATIETLGEALPKEMDRVRALIEIYKSVPMEFLAAKMMENDLREAQQAITAGDVVAMIRAYTSLKGYEE